MQEGEAFEINIHAVLSLPSPSPHTHTVPGMERERSDRILSVLFSVFSVGLFRKGNILGVLFSTFLCSFLSRITFLFSSLLASYPFLLSPLLSPLHPLLSFPFPLSSCCFPSLLLLSSFSLPAFTPPLTCFPPTSQNSSSPLNHFPSFPSPTHILPHPLFSSSPFFIISHPLILPPFIFLFFPPLPSSLPSFTPVSLSLVLLYSRHALY